MNISDIYGYEKVLFIISKGKETNVRVTVLSIKGC